MHKTVLLKEAVEGLKVKKGDVVIDATLGGGGHTIKLAKKVSPNGKVIAIDFDGKAIEQFEKKNKTESFFKNIILVNDNFASLAEILKKEKIEKVQGILADLGWRREQIDDPTYGMSFRQNSQLDMRLNSQAQSLTAREVVNDYTESELAEVFFRYGEEKQARKIAQRIVSERKESPIETTGELVAIIEKVKANELGRRIHPATKIFQALRIEVNRELENLEKFLQQSLEGLDQGSRLAVIAFHSLEDKLVKEFFRTNARGCVCPKEVPLCVCHHTPELKIITKKPIRPGKEELESNPSSRSAKMRIAEKIDNK